MRLLLMLTNDATSIGETFGSDRALQIQMQQEKTKTSYHTLKVQIQDIQQQKLTSQNDSKRDGYVTKYFSSDWEKLWLENIGTWQKQGICEAIAGQKEQLHSFLNDTCSAATDTPWCLIDDSVHQLWYHTLDGRVESSKPSAITNVFEIRPVSPKNPKIWSWFEHEHTVTKEVIRDYIEPLVSHLRHPLARCGPYGEMFLVDRSYVIPGSCRDTTGKGKTFLFDAGASSWNDGAGGPSLSYFAQVWKRNGFHWDKIEAWEATTPSNAFYNTVPAEWKDKTEYHQAYISTDPFQTPFVPTVIEQKTSKDDYVVFKLDIDSKAVETKVVEFLLDWKFLGLVDEFLWEHHVNNYLMAPNWGDAQDMTKSIADSYKYFLRLRQLSVRAHSWV